MPAVNQTPEAPGPIPEDPDVAWETAPAVARFVPTALWVALVVLLMRTSPEWATLPGLALGSALAAAYIGPSVPGTVARLRAAVHGRWVRILAGPLVLGAVAAGYSAWLKDPARAVALWPAYLLLPALLLAPGATRTGRPPLRELAAIAVLWLPVELRVLPAIPVPGPVGYDAARFFGLLDALYLFTVVRHLDLGYSFALRPADIGRALLAFLAFAVVALPIGFLTHFIQWKATQQHAGPALLSALLIYLTTALPEELLFRGMIQGLLVEWVGPWGGLLGAAVIFGLAHLPDPRYVVLATLAGIAYGWVYLRTRRTTASAITHMLVDAMWVALLRA